MLKTTRFKFQRELWDVIHTFRLRSQDSKVFFTFLNFLLAQTKTHKMNGGYIRCRGVIVD